MPKPRSKNTSEPSSLLAPLKRLMVPAFAAQCESDSPSYHVSDPEPGELPSIQGCLRGGHLVRVVGIPLDETRITLRFALLAGHLIEDTPSDALLVGGFIESTPFHVRSDVMLGLRGRLTIGCDLVVREDDAPLAARRLAEMLDLGDDLNWFFPLRLPTRLGSYETEGLEIDWDELPHDNLAGFLDDGLKSPRDERTPLLLLRLAQGLGRWQDVLRLLRDHPDSLDAKFHAPLKCMALRQLQRWLPAIRAAKEGGLRNGRYPGSPWLSPSYLHALIEAGDEIEALRLLGKTRDDEPGFYHWFRGVAFHRAGDFKQADAAFECHFDAWPGDILGGATIHHLDDEP